MLPSPLVIQVHVRVLTKPFNFTNDGVASSG